MTDWKILNKNYYWSQWIRNNSNLVVKQNKTVLVVVAYQQDSCNLYWHQSSKITMMMTMIMAVEAGYFLVFLTVSCRFLSSFSFYFQRFISLSNSLSSICKLLDKSHYHKVFIPKDAWLATSQLVAFFLSNNTATISIRNI